VFSANEGDPKYTSKIADESVAANKKTNKNNNRETEHLRMKGKHR
tara:strand:+ start:357 stop:491 length:135 start_codon:yes stop_codon:yes gene_type:complete